MTSLDRRTFLATLTGSVVSASTLPLEKALARVGPPPAKPCWLDLAIPFVVEDPARGLHTEIVLTAACFQGVRGYAEPKYATRYEIHLYDHAGRAQPLDREKTAKRLRVPAMHTTTLRCAELLGQKKPFWGGMRIRVLPKGGGLSHIGDLFSAGFIRWYFNDRFDNVHASPDPPQFISGKYYYSMPLPNLSEYFCALSLFNPYSSPSAGKIIICDRNGAKILTRSFGLAPRRSTLFHVNAGQFAADPGAVFGRPSRETLSEAGNVMIENEASTVKSFAYLLVKGKERNVLTAEHPLYQGDYPIRRAPATPFDAGGSFRAKSLVYSPLFFRRKRVGDLQLSARAYLSIGRALEDTLWLMPFATNADGTIAWVSNRDETFERRLPEGFYDRGMIKLKTLQSCVLDADRLPLARGYSGGIGVAATPETSHTLMKIEVRAANWGASALTHFRPGGLTAKRYRQVEDRGGVATDYLVSGVRLERSAEGVERDCLLAIMNIDFQGETPGDPALEIFGPEGLLKRVRLGRFPALGCKHMRLSDLVREIGTDRGQHLTLRLIDRDAIMIMSVVHIDFRRRDIALDHGSDRHATYADYHCRG